MTTYIALLRAINVSGHRKIPMAELRTSCAALGWQDVRTYLQSGNVVFRTRATSAADLAARLGRRIARDFSHDVDVQIMSDKQWQRIVDTNPLWPPAGGDDRHYHATFLARPVSAKRFAGIPLPRQAGEQAALVGQVVFLHCPLGYGNTKLSNAFFEKALAVPATTRNWRTVLALRALCALPTGTE
jgi:uncharacterized protein (DUF1697 family)